MEIASQKKVLKLSFKYGLIFLKPKILAKKYLKNLALDFKENPNHLFCKAFYYRQLFSFLIRNKVEFLDAARDYKKLTLPKASYKLHRFQQKALNDWMKKKRGILVLPTGAGKTLLAMSALQILQRSVLILVPTIDLTKQWQQKLTKTFNTSVGLLGGGSKEILDVTVSTYDSAAIHSDKIGNRFGVLIFDEVHHASAWGNFVSAQNFIAPYRLGLTATMPSDEGRLARLTKIVGPKLMDVELSNLTGSYLSDYDLIRLEVALTAEERVEYLKHRGIYQEFRAKISSSRPNLSWARFAIIAYSSAAGKVAMNSFLLQKKIAFSAKGKFLEIGKILKKHLDSKILIFTNDNESALKISEQFNLALITHKTSKKNRVKILEDLKKGKTSQVVSSKVLNEGIDVPDISVGVIFSGTSTVREQMQRLGRILRKVDGKKATLYELVAKDTFEVFVSEKRNSMIDGLL